MFAVKKFDLVIALYIFGILVAELMGAKTFPIYQHGSFHLNSSVAIFVMPLIFTLIDSVIEVYGKKRARSMVYSGLVVITLLILFALLATHLPPSSRFKSTEPAYDKIFESSVRLALASLIAFAVSELLDVALFSKLRQMMHKKALWLRNNLTNFVAQFSDSAVFLTLAFYAVHESFGANFSFLFGLLLPYWLLRCGLSILGTPLVYAGVWWLKKEDR